MYIYMHHFSCNEIHCTSPQKKSVYHEICHNSCLIACDVRHAQHIGGVAGSESTMWCVIQNWDQFPVQTSRHATRNKRRRIAKKYLIRVQEHPSLLSTAFHEILFKKKIMIQDSPSLLLTFGTSTWFQDTNFQSHLPPWECPNFLPRHPLPSRSHCLGFFGEIFGRRPSVWQISKRRCSDFFEEKGLYLLDLRSCRGKPIHMQLLTCM